MGAELRIEMLKGSVRVELTRILAGPIYESGDMQFFEIRDLEEHLIEICKEP